METKKMIPYGAALLGAVLGNWLYTKKPMYGNLGRGGAIIAGAAGGYFISDFLVKKFSSNTLPEPKASQDIDEEKVNQKIEEQSESDS